MKFPFLWSAIALIAVTIIIAGAPLFIDWNQYRNNIEKWTQNHIRENVTINGNINLKLFPQPVININNVIIGKQISIEKLKLKLKTTPLLTGTIDVDAFEIINPIISIQQKNIKLKKNLINNIKNALQNNDNKIILNKITLQNGNVRIIKDKNHTDIISDIHMTISAPAINGPIKTNGNAIHNNTRYTFTNHIAKAKRNNAISIALTIRAQQKNKTETKLSFNGRIKDKQKGNDPILTGAMLIEKNNKTENIPIHNFPRIEANVDVYETYAQMNDIDVTWSPLKPTKINQSLTHKSAAQGKNTIRMRGNGTAIWKPKTTLNLQLEATHLRFTNPIFETKNTHILAQTLQNDINQLIKNIPQNIDVKSKINIQNIEINTKPITNLNLNIHIRNQIFNITKLSASIAGSARLTLSALYHAQQKKWDGTLQLHTESLNNTIQWSGLKPLQKNALLYPHITGKANIKSRFQIMPDATHITNINAQLDQAVLTGTVYLKNTLITNADLDLKLDQFNLQTSHFNPAIRHNITPYLAQNGDIVLNLNIPKTRLISQNTNTQKAKPTETIKTHMSLNAHMRLNKNADLHIHNALLTQEDGYLQWSGIVDKTGNAQMNLDLRMPIKKAILHLKALNVDMITEPITRRQPDTSGFLTMRGPLAIKNGQITATADATWQDKPVVIEAKYHPESQHWNLSLNTNRPEIWLSEKVSSPTRIPPTQMQQGMNHYARIAVEAEKNIIHDLSADIRLSDLEFTLKGSGTIPNLRAKINLKAPFNTIAKRIPQIRHLANTQTENKHLTLSAHIAAQNQIYKISDAQLTLDQETAEFNGFIDQSRQKPEIKGRAHISNLTLNHILNAALPTDATPNSNRNTQSITLNTKTFNADIALTINKIALIPQSEHHHIANAGAHLTIRNNDLNLNILSGTLHQNPVIIALNLREEADKRITLSAGFDLEQGKGVPIRNILTFNPPNLLQGTLKLSGTLAASARTTQALKNDIRAGGQWELCNGKIKELNNQSPVNITPRNTIISTEDITNITRTIADNVQNGTVTLDCLEGDYHTRKGQIIFNAETLKQDTLSLSPKITYTLQSNTLSTAWRINYHNHQNSPDITLKLAGKPTNITAKYDTENFTQYITERIIKQNEETYRQLEKQRQEEILKLKQAEETRKRRARLKQFLETIQSTLEDSEQDQEPDIEQNEKPQTPNDIQDSSIPQKSSTSQEDNTQNPTPDLNPIQPNFVPEETTADPLSNQTLSNEP